MIKESWNKWLWFFIRLFNNFVGSTFFVVFSFLLWQDEQSISTLLAFNFFTFLSIAIGVIITGELAVFISLKKIFILGLLARIGLITFLYINVESIPEYVVLASILFGFSSSFFWNADNLLGQELVGEKNLISYTALLQIAFSLISILVPFFINYTFDQLTTEIYLLLVAGLLGLAILISLPLKDVKPKNNMSIMDTFNELFEQRAVRDLAILNTAVGMGTAFSLGILDVIILEKLGSLQNWTYFSFLLAIAGIFVTNQIRKIKTDEMGKLRVVISIGLLVYAAIPILLYSYFNLYVLIVFVFAKVFFDKITSSALIPYMVRVQQGDTDFEKKKLDYTIFSNFFWVLGKLLPIGLLFVLPEEILSVDILLYVLVAITFVPLYFASRLKTRYANFFDAN